jgi:hypothetical protein
MLFSSRLRLNNVGAAKNEIFGYRLALEQTAGNSTSPANEQPAIGGE